MFSFAALWVFIFLPLPLLVYFFLSPKDEQKNNGIIVPFYQETLIYSDSRSKSSSPILKKFTLLIIWVLLVAATAKPQWLGTPQALTQSGRDLLLAVDISESMEQADMEINRRSATRIASVKKVVSEFIAQRKGDRIGLVLFGSNAYLQTPLTFDTHSVKTFLEEAQLGFAGPKTAIGDAIGLSVKSLQEQDTANNNRVIILLTDGANTAGEIDPVQAADLARQINTKIYTIGIGADEMVIRSFFGNRRINPSAALDEDTLEAIATTTDGRYFRARNTDELNQIYQELNALEPIAQDQQWFRPITSLFMWPLGLAMALCLLLTVSKIRQYSWMN